LPERRSIATRPFLANALLGILLAATPALLLTAFLHFYFGATVFDYSSAYDVDQYFYYNETASFSVHGLNSGYYGAGEKAAVLGGYGPHGLGYPAVTGTIAALTGGMRLYSIPLINLAFLTVALAVFVACVNPTAGYLVKFWLFLLTFPPLILFLPVGLQDGFHYGIAVTLAWMFYRLIRQDEKGGTGRFRWVVLGAILAACAIRNTWAFLFIPYFFIIAPDSFERPLWPLVKSGSMFLAVYFLFNLFVSPWVASLGADPDFAVNASRGHAAFLLDLSLRNVMSLLDFKSNFFSNLISLEMFVFIFGAGLLPFFFSRRVATANAISARTARLLGLFNLTVSGLLFLILVLIYTGSGHHLPRLLSAGFILSVLLSLRLLKSKALLLVLVANVMLLPMTMDHAQRFLLQAYLDPKPNLWLVQTFKNQIAPSLRYDESANRWGNTIVMERPHMAAYLGLPPGIGIQLLGREIPATPFKSRYFLLSDNGYDILSRHSPLTKIGDTFLGGLYRNAAPPDKKEAPAVGGAQ